MVVNWFVIVHCVAGDGDRGKFRSCKIPRILQTTVHLMCLCLSTVLDNDSIIVSFLLLVTKTSVTFVATRHHKPDVVDTCTLYVPETKYGVG